MKDVKIDYNANQLSSLEDIIKAMDILPQMSRQIYSQEQNKKNDSVCNLEHNDKNKINEDK